MEMPPDTLETVGINELFVVVGVDASFTTEQTVSGSSGTHNSLSSIRHESMQEVTGRVLSIL